MTNDTELRDADRIALARYLTLLYSTGPSLEPRLVTAFESLTTRQLDALAALLYEEGVRGSGVPQRSRAAQPGRSAQQGRVAGPRSAAGQQPTPDASTSPRRSGRPRRKRSAGAWVGLWTAGVIALGIGASFASGLLADALSVSSEPVMQAYEGDVADGWYD